MRLPLIFVLPVLVLNALVDWYICRVVKKRCRRSPRLWNRLALWSSVALAVFFIAAICWPKKGAGDAGLIGLMWSLYVYFSIYIPKYIFVISDLLGRIPQLWHARPLPGGRIVPKVLAALAFVLMVSGPFNSRRISVEEVDYTNPSLPQAFDGLKIAQISDLHTGTYGNDTSFVSRLVDRVNSLRPDIVVFTGDIVNRHSSEIEPFLTVLSRLKAPLGVYSIMGNHDYGDYYRWPDEAAHFADSEHLKFLQDSIGWKMLNNESRVFRAGSDSLVLIGVENIGDPPFRVYGDLDAAYHGDLADDAFKILLSHNPAHWCADIAESPDKNIALTLSGHTHAMQIELLGLSPAAFRYDTWGGLYSDTGGAHHLYVNIGAGEVGIPARIGATPEITLFTLRR